MGIRDLSTPWMLHMPLFHTPAQTQCCVHTAQCPAHLHLLHPQPWGSGAGHGGGAGLVHKDCLPPLWFGWEGERQGSTGESRGEADWEPGHLGSLPAPVHCWQPSLGNAISLLCASASPWAVQCQLWGSAYLRVGGPWRKAPTAPRHPDSPVQGLACTACS